MFFAMLILLIWALLATGAAFDKFGWLMLVGTAWVAGYLDCRMFRRFDKDPDRVMPPGDGDEADSSAFR